MVSAYNNITTEARIYFEFEMPIEEGFLKRHLHSAGMHVNCIDQFSAMDHHSESKSALSGILGLITPSGPFKFIRKGAASDQEFRNMMEDTRQALENYPSVSSPRLSVDVNNKRKRQTDHTDNATPKKNSTKVRNNPTILQMLQESEEVINEVNTELQETKAIVKTQEDELIVIHDKYDTNHEKLSKTSIKLNLSEASNREKDIMLLELGNTITKYEQDLLTFKTQSDEKLKTVKSTADQQINTLKTEVAVSANKAEMYRCIAMEKSNEADSLRFYNTRIREENALLREENNNIRAHISSSQINGQTHGATTLVNDHGLMPTTEQLSLIMDVNIGPQMHKEVDSTSSPGVNISSSPIPSTMPIQSFNAQPMLVLDRDPAYSVCLDNGMKVPQSGKKYNHFAFAYTGNLMHFKYYNLHHVRHTKIKGVKSVTDQETNINYIAVRLLKSFAVKPNKLGDIIGLFFNLWKNPLLIIPPLEHQVVVFDPDYPILNPIVAAIRAGAGKCSAWDRSTDKWNL
jgi:hypothetical protein